MYSHFRHGPTDPDKLHVVTMVSNPSRYRSRYDLYHRFSTGVERAGASLLTAELAFGARPFEITRADDPRHLQLRTNDEIWQKENALNLLVQRLPQDWKYVAWIDADVEFVRHDWADEIVHQLQHYAVVQCFQNAVDLGPNGETLKVDNGFVWSWQTKGLPREKKYYGAYHPGYAWAMRRDAFDHLGGLLDTAILGAGDRHMAWALIGQGAATVDPRLAPAYRRHVLQWQDRAERHVRHNVGYVPGTLVHHWHGRKADRRYHDRWQILIKHGFDPDVDVKRDWQGLWQFSDQGVRMRNDLRAYFRQRNEDGTEA